MNKKYLTTPQQFRDFLAEEWGLKTKDKVTMMNNSYFSFHFEDENIAPFVARSPIQVFLELNKRGATINYTKSRKEPNGLGWTLFYTVNENEVEQDESVEDESKDEGSNQEIVDLEYAATLETAKELKEYLEPFGMSVNARKKPENILEDAKKYFKEA